VTPPPGGEINPSVEIAKIAGAGAAAGAAVHTGAHLLPHLETGLRDVAIAGALAALAAIVAVGKVYIGGETGAPCDVG